MSTLIAGMLEFKGRFLWDNQYFQLVQGASQRLTLNSFSSQTKALEGGRPLSSRSVTGVQTLRDRPNCRPHRFDVVLTNDAKISLAAPSAADKARWIDKVSSTLGIGAGLGVATPPNSPGVPMDVVDTLEAGSARHGTAAQRDAAGLLALRDGEDGTTDEDAAGTGSHDDAGSDAGVNATADASTAAGGPAVAEVHNYLAHLPPAQRDRSWRANIGRGGGFWADALWYDAQIDRRMPGVGAMMEELVAACPPAGRARVADLCAGSGRAAAGVAAAYPTARLTLIDTNEERLGLAAARLPTAEVLCAAVGPDTHMLPGAPYDIIVASLAIRVLVSRPAHYFPQQTAPPTAAEMRADFAKLLQCLHRSLSPGGHVLIADHDGAFTLFEHLKGLESAGFDEVDCSWRQREYFVCGGRQAAYEEM